jgi:transcriptional regulator of arginine metabolism
MSAGKKERHSLILHIISGEPVSTQKELLLRLLKHGVRTTQATLSRDIRDLGLVKVAIAGSRYRYLPGGGSRPAEAPPVADGVVFSISRAGNLLVVRTRPGFAQSVAASIDALSWSEVLGTVGGDDTVLIVLGDQKKAAGVGKRLRLFFALESGH